MRLLLQVKRWSIIGMSSSSGESIIIRVDLNTKASGRAASDTAKVLRYGLTAPPIRDSGKMGELRVTASLFILTVRFTRVTGVMIKPMEKAPTLKKMVLSVVGIGAMTFNMVYVSKPHKMENTVASFSMVTNMESAASRGRTVPDT